MKFAEIIRGAGYEPEHFPMCSQLSITLYDESRRKVVGGVRFLEPFFKRNETSYKKFGDYLTHLENELKEGTTEEPKLYLQLTSNFLMVNCYTAESAFFYRNL